MTCFATPLRSARIPALVQRQRGMTLVELLVAMAIGLLVVLVTVAALLMSRQGAATVDASSQLRDDSRFASQLIQRLVVQAGFEDWNYAGGEYSGSSAIYKLKNNNLNIGALQPSVYGFDNALASPTDPLNASLTRTDSYNGDILILQYQTVKSNFDQNSSETDGSMITCAGTSPSIAATNRGDRAISVLHLAVSAGEPTLMCTTRNDTTGVFYTVPLVKGVESFQVLYGVDNVTPGAVLPATPPATGCPTAICVPTSSRWLATPWPPTQTGGVCAACASAWCCAAPPGRLCRPPQRLTTRWASRITTTVPAILAASSLRPTTACDRP